MPRELPITDITNSLRIFRRRRDDLLHEDADAFDHHLERFVEFCRDDPLVQRVLGPLVSKYTVDVDSWWEEASEYRGKITFPKDVDEELLLRFKVLESVSDEEHNLFHIGYGGRKKRDYVDYFRTVVIRPLADELSHRLGEEADLASPDARAAQAVPLRRIPSDTESKIFLSHKTVDKPLVYRYFHALKEAGFDPWLDEQVMAAGANLEREVLRGFEESCAAVFFITENFSDEKYLAAEVDYAVMQKRKRNDKFAIITLRYPDAEDVPGLLTPYIFKNVENDLDGYYELLRALPIELGPVRWKKEVVD